MTDDFEMEDWFGCPERGSAPAPLFCAKENQHIDTNASLPSPYFLTTLNLPNKRYLVHFDSHIWLLQVFILLFCSRSEGRSPLSLLCVFSHLILVPTGLKPSALLSSFMSSALGSPWQLYPS